MGLANKPSETDTVTSSVIVNDNRVTLQGIKRMEVLSNSNG